MQLTALEVDIFRVCRKRYPERIARVASVALYWSQFAEYQLRGRLGIYKTDDDLAAGPDRATSKNLWGEFARGVQRFGAEHPHGPF